VLATIHRNHSEDWLTNGLAQWENAHRRRREGIRALGSQAVPVLEQELYYDPVYYKLLATFPSLRRFLPKPLFYPEDPPSVRIGAADALAVLGSDAQEAVPDLVRRSSDPDPDFRSAVASALGSIGVSSSKVKTVLARMTQDEFYTVSISAAVSLWQMDPENSELRDRIRSLLQKNQQPFADLRLVRLGRAGRPLVPVLEEVIAGMSWSHYRMKLVHVLWSFTGDKERILNEFHSLGIAITNQSAGIILPGWTPCELALSYAGNSEMAEVGEFRSALRPLLRELVRTKSALAVPNAPYRYWPSAYLRKFERMDGQQDDADSSAQQNR